ncbi:MAG: glycosyltransferase [Gammaproteobacteria bacterium]|nr:glycosyltransferase [Gammaproteobacteria bacterium]
MRILKISDVYFPRVNGVSTSIRTFAHELQQAGHEVTLIAPDYPGAGADSFEILRVPSRYLFVDPEDRLMQRRLVRCLRDRLRGRRFDIVHVHTPFAAHYEGVWLARQLGIPVIETCHTYFEEYLDKYLTWLPRQALRYVARRFSRSQCAEVDGIVVPTQPMLDVLRGYGISAEAAVIPTGIPAGAFSNGDGARFRAAHGIGADRQVMLYVGRVAHEKNIDFLLRVADRVRRRLPRALLVIAGEGPAENHLRRVARSLHLGDHVTFVGYLARDAALPDCYAAADVFTFASATETQGLVLLEAMQAGTPVVSTAVMGTAEVMADREGGLVADADVDAFADQVCRLLADGTLRAAMRAQARRKAARWSAPATAARMAELYANCIARARRPPGDATAGPARDAGDDSLQPATVRSRQRSRR